MNLGDKLEALRKSSAMTQEQAASLLNIPRELLSMWESGKRIPSAVQLTSLARLYGVNQGYLLGVEDLKVEEDLRVLYRGKPEAQSGIRQWLEFLDRWATFREEIHGAACLSGPRKPPKAIDEGYTVDTRRASKLALGVRTYYNLGEDALPDLWAFTDEQGILVYKAPLGGLHNGGISGAFLNHPKLGWCILVNTSVTPGRQVFTLAHELAHAIYHYRQRRLVSRADPEDPEERSRERFANAWAAHFLVPGSALRQQLKRVCESFSSITEYETFQLALFFRVSYSTLVYRLLGEGYIDDGQKERLLEPRVEDIAARLGLPPDDYIIPEKPEVWDLERYPVSVLQHVRDAIENDMCSVHQAARLLEADINTIQDELLGPLSPDQKRRNRIEFDELPPLR
jgi:Zn-dependent peptidase ImmA (M78 family)/transcriptional regulator with XRE-family HTH domain